MKDGNFGNHFTVTDQVYRRWHGSFVGFFRNPALRAQSAYTHFVLPTDSLELRADNSTRVTQAEYASRIRGSQTTMLSGQACACYAHAHAMHMHMHMPCTCIYYMQLTVASSS